MLQPAADAGAEHLAFGVDDPAVDGQAFAVFDLDRGEALVPGPDARDLFAGKGELPRSALLLPDRQRRAVFKNEAFAFKRRAVT